MRIGMSKRTHDPTLIDHLGSAVGTLLLAGIMLVHVDAAS